MADVVIREARSGDGEGLAVVWLDAARTFTEQDPERFRVPERDGLAEWLERNVADGDADRLSLVAETDARIIGLLEAHLDPPLPGARFQLVRGVGDGRVTVETVAVLSAERRRGVGRRLLEAAEDWARERGATVVRLHTDPDGPLTGPFYRALGYRQDAALLRKFVR